MRKTDLRQSDSSETTHLDSSIGLLRFYPPHFNHTQNALHLHLMHDADVPLIILDALSDGINTLECSTDV